MQGLPTTSNSSVSETFFKPTWSAGGNSDDVLDIGGIGFADWKVIVIVEDE